MMNRKAPPTRRPPATYRQLGVAAAITTLVGGACDTTDVHNEENFVEFVDPGRAGSSTGGRSEPIINIVRGGQPGAQPGNGSSGNGGSGGGMGGDTSTAAPDGGSSPPDAVGGASPVPDGGGPLFDGAPIANTAPADLDLDIYGAVANRYFFIVNDEQLARMNGNVYGGGPFGNGDIYTPNGGESATFVDHLLATPAGSDKTADYGKVQVRPIGGSTYRPWDASNIPNLKIDADEFIEGNRIGTAKHVRFNNAIIGSIFREKFVFDVYRRLGYPAPRATFGWVSSNVWAPGVSIPYVVVESYKPQFCSLREDELGGGCENMWEGYGDIDYFSFGAEDYCQFSECDPSHAFDFQDAVLSTSPGPGFKDALESWVEWDSFHQFQCLTWMLDTGDDALHANNNVVIAERADGKFQYLPYSVDLSLNHDWVGTGVSLGAESSVIARGCAADPDCWADTIATCEGLIQDFTALDPVGMLDDMYAELEEQGMLRSGDEGRYEVISNYLEERVENLPAQLELNRDEPYYPSYCYYYGQVDCGGYCAYPEECDYCGEEGGGGGGDDQGGCVVFPDGAVVCQGGGGVEIAPADNGAMGDVAPAIGIALPDPDPAPEPGGDGGEPVGCVPFVNLY